MSHFGRPKLGGPGAFSAALDRSLEKAIGPEGGLARIALAKRQTGVEALQPGQVCFSKPPLPRGEEQTRPTLPVRLPIGDVYIDDAFSAAHRAHARSPRCGLVPAAAGKLMEADAEGPNARSESRRGRCWAIIGAPKCRHKLDLLRFFDLQGTSWRSAGRWLNTLFAGRGEEVGRSLCERDMAERARQILASHATELPADPPEDASSLAELAPGAARYVASAGPTRSMILDIGPERWPGSTASRKARTSVWNGPLGAFETPPFDRGTMRWQRSRRAHPGPEGCQRRRRCDTVAALAQAEYRRASLRL